MMDALRTGPAAPRNVPRRKLGFLPVLAWLLLAVHGPIPAASAQSEPAAPPLLVNASAAPVPYDEAMAAIMGGANTAAPAARMAAALPAAPVPAEIVELARALRNDPDLIYEYVHNNIETLPQYGSLKGPLGTLLDGKGTAFDQAELMAALLHQAGYGPTLEVGKINLTVDRLTSWLGSDATYNSLEMILGTGGFPTTSYVSGANVVEADIGWAWVPG